MIEVDIVRIYKYACSNVDNIGSSNIVVTILIIMIAGIFAFFFVEPECGSTAAVSISDERSGTSVTETVGDNNMYQKR